MVRGWYVVLTLSMEWGRRMVQTDVYEVQACLFVGYYAGTLRVESLVWVRVWVGEWVWVWGCGGVGGGVGPRKEVPSCSTVCWGLTHSSSSELSLPRVQARNHGASSGCFCDAVLPNQHCLTTCHSLTKHLSHPFG